MALIAHNDNVTSTYKEGENYTKPLIIITCLFFMWALITNINDILIPHLKKACDLTDFQSSLVQFAFFIAYLIMSVPSGMVINKLGYKGGMILGLIVMMTGALLFIPAAYSLNYILFLVGLFVLGSGVTLLQVAANPYVTLLGKPETSSTRLNLAQAFNSLGATVGPFVGGALILSGIEFSVEQWASLSQEEQLQYRLKEASAVIMPFTGIAITLFVLATVIYFSKLPVIGTQARSDKPEKLNGTAWQFSHLTYGAIAIFLYVGAEVCIGSFLIRFAGEPDIANLKDSDAKLYPSLYMLGAMIGRFIGSAVLTKVSPSKALSFTACMAIILLVIGIFTKGYLALTVVTLVGLFNSIMFPTMFTLGIAGLGRYTKQGSSYLVMAIVGGGIIPPIMGLVSGVRDIQFAFIVPIACYVFVLYYGLSGYKVKMKDVQ